MATTLKKKAILMLLGNKCLVCGKTSNLTIHHVNKKKYILKKKTLEVIAKNSDKLECLCRGCHNIHHALYDQSLSYIRNMARLRKADLKTAKSNKAKDHYFRTYSQITLKFLKKKAKANIELEEHFLKEYPSFNWLFEIVNKERGEIPGYNLV